MNGIILFDGECNLCSWSVQFIIKRDRKGYFKFASLQSRIGEELLEPFNPPNEMDSFFLIEYGKCYSQSTAALRIFRSLNGLWPLCSSLFIIPKPIRDVFYGLIARNRYKWFGKKDQCMIPTPQIKDRFL